MARINAASGFSWFLILLLLFGSVPASGGSIAARDPRAEVDPQVAPWSAVVKVQANIGTRCTGALVAPTIVMTAAHCLYNRLTGALLQPVSLHVLIGYRRAEFRWHRLVIRYTTGPGYDAKHRPPQTSDWVRLELAEAIPAEVTPLAVAIHRPAPGAPIAIAGYGQDRAQLLMADLECHVTGVAKQATGTFLLHNCAATRGTSGAPLLVEQNGAWFVAGINIGTGPQGGLALAAPFSE